MINAPPPPMLHVMDFETEEKLSYLNLNKTSLLLLSETNEEYR